MISGGTAKRGPAKSGDEQDCLSRRARRALVFTQKPGVTARVKRAVRRRERQAGKVR